ncbi:MAG: phosphatidylglycerophosphatase A [Chitinivibrionales bacterium]|nr:phosphatidylglycerophosphatase A [Chitinivibrionales bacterium]MBD3358863.1 phosphatidylglycerophosphatase A [Chitinivibrionales bacterium]
MTRVVGIWGRRALSSLLFLGYFPLFPGTVGSAATVAALWYFRESVGPYSGHIYFWLASLGVAALSVFLSNGHKDVYGGDNDPKQIVVDECAGQLITFFMVPITVRTLILGLLLFRFFDIVKPYPIHKFEELEDGLGVTMDDVVAGVFANISLIAILWIYHGLTGWLAGIG